MGFINFLAYMKYLGEKVLVFFPSKTNLISIADSSGNPTEELLSERLERIEDAIHNTVTYAEIDALISNLIPWEPLKAEKSGYLGFAQNKYGIPYSSLETGTVYWLLLQNSAIVEYSYHGERATPDAVVLYRSIPDGYRVCGYGNKDMPYGQGYIYYATDNEEKECPEIKIIKKSALCGGG